MGALAIAAVAGGIAMGAGGAYMSAQGAKKQTKALLDAQNQWLPNVQGDTQDYFRDLGQYQSSSIDLSRTMNREAMSQAMERREMALPGSMKRLGESAPLVFDLMQGKLPMNEIRNALRSGNANSIGKGIFGETGDFMTQLFGAGGVLKGMQLGYSLLPSLLGAVPTAPMMSPGAWLEGLMTPAQRTQAQLNVRGQNIGLQTAASGIPNSDQVWGKWLSATGGQMAGAGMSGMGGMGGASMGANANQTSTRNPAYGNDYGVMY